MRCPGCEGAGYFMHCNDPECMVRNEPCERCYGEGQVCESCLGPLDGRVGESDGLCADCAEEAFGTRGLTEVKECLEAGKK